jgi:hypothetical protein
MPNHERHLRMYSTALRALPQEFSGRYGAEMELLLTARLQSEASEIGRWQIASAECMNVLFTALQLRCRRQTIQKAALLGSVLLLAVVRMPDRGTPAVLAMSPADSVDFVATDPAGNFTLNVRYGRAVAGTIDHHPLSRRQLIQTGDSIRVLNPNGHVLFAVAYDRAEARIEWTARPAQCRGRPLTCAAD